MDAALKGTGEIALAVLATTLSLVVIFVPVSFMSSISGRFLYQFGVTAAVAVLVSLLVSFTLTPMMASRMLKPPPADGKGHTQSRAGFYGLLDRAYVGSLRLCLKRRWLTMIVAVIVMGSSVPLYRLLPQNYLPSNVDEAEFSINVSGPEGISFEAFDNAMREVEARVAAHPAVVTTLTSVGGSFLGQINRGDIYVRIKPHAERLFSLSRLWQETLRGAPLNALRGNYSQSSVMQDLRRSLRDLPDLRASVRPFAAFNIGGGNFDVALALRGPDLQRLAEYTATLRLRALELGGLPDPDTTLKLDTPEMRAIIDRDRAADLGVAARDLGIALRLLVGGDEEITRFRDESANEEYDVQLRLVRHDRADPRELPRLLVPAANTPGGVAEVRSFATLEPAQAPARVDRLDRVRAANLRSSIGPGYALADRLGALRAEVDKLNMPPEYTVRVLGRGRELERTFNEFILAFLLSLVFMYMILASNYESYLHPSPSCSPSHSPSRSPSSRCGPWANRSTSIRRSAFSCSSAWSRKTPSCRLTTSTRSPRAACPSKKP